MFIVDSYINQLNENASKPIGNIDSRSLLLECGFYNDMILNENTFTDRVKELFAKFKKIMKELGRKIVTAVKTMINKVKSIFTKRSINTKKIIEDNKKNLDKICEDLKKDRDKKMDDIVEGFKENLNNYNVEIPNKYEKPITGLLYSLPNFEIFNVLLYIKIGFIENCTTIDELKKASIEIKNILQDPDSIMNSLKATFKLYIRTSFYADLFHCNDVNGIIELIHQSNLSENDKIHLNSRDEIEGMIRFSEDYINNDYFNNFTNIIKNIDEKLIPSLEKEIDKDMNMLEKYSNQIFKNIVTDQSRCQEFIKIINEILSELASYKSKIPQLASYIIQIVNAIYNDYEYSLKEAEECIEIMKQYLASHK